MIKPQSITLREAYEPYLSVERVLYLDANRNGYAVPHAPTSGYEEWCHMITFDNEHYEVLVVGRGFKTVAAIRAALEFILWQAKKDFRIGGITDVISENEYASRNNPITVQADSVFPE